MNANYLPKASIAMSKIEIVNAIMGKVFEYSKKSKDESKE